MTLTALSRCGNEAAWPHLRALHERMRARPADQRALQKGGPVVIGQ